MIIISSPAGVLLDQTPVTPVHVDPTLSAQRTDRVTLCAHVCLGMNLSLTPSLAAAESRPGLLPPTHATPVPVVPTLSAMSMVWVTQCVSASVDMFLLRTPSLAARSSLTHATPTHVDQELTVFPPETEQLVDVLLDTRETHLLAAGLTYLNYSKLLASCVLMLQEGRM